MKSRIPAVLSLCVLLIVTAGCGGGSAIDLNKVTVTVTPCKEVVGRFPESDSR